MKSLPPHPFIEKGDLLIGYDPGDEKLSDRAVKITYKIHANHIEVLKVEYSNKYKR